MYIHNSFNLPCFFLKFITKNIYASYSVNPTDDTHEDFISAQDDEDNFDEDESEDEDVTDFMGLTNAQSLWVLPLYSLLPGHKQAKVNM